MKKLSIILAGVMLIGFNSLAFADAYDTAVASKRTLRNTAFTTARSGYTTTIAARSTSLSSSSSTAVSTARTTVTTRIANPRSVGP